MFLQFIRITKTKRLGIDTQRVLMYISDILSQAIGMQSDMSPTLEYRGTCAYILRAIATHKISMVFKLEDSTGLCKT